MKITVLGKGCFKCKNTIRLIEEEATKLGIAITIDKITDDVQIVEHGIMTTPAIMINGNIVHVGSIPKPQDIQDWLKT